VDGGSIPTCKYGAIATLHPQVVICEHTPAAITQQQQFLYSSWLLLQRSLSSAWYLRTTVPADDILVGLRICTPGFSQQLAACAGHLVS
jgi:hypothetical protein